MILTFPLSWKFRETIDVDLVLVKDLLLHFSMAAVG